MFVIRLKNICGRIVVVVVCLFVCFVFILHHHVTIIRLLLLLLLLLLLSLISRSVNKDARYNAHGHQFLKQQLASVRDVDLAEASGVVAEGAGEGLFAQVSDGDQAALVAHMHSIGITVQTTNKQTMLQSSKSKHTQAHAPVAVKSVAQEVGCAVADQAISFHLSHAQPTFSCATFHRLSRQHRHWTSAACMDFIVDQVLQALFVSQSTKKNESNNMLKSNKTKKTK